MCIIYFCCCFKYREFSFIFNCVIGFRVYVNSMCKRTAQVQENVVDFVCAREVNVAASTFNFLTLFIQFSIGRFVHFLFDTHFSSFFVSLTFIFLLWVLLQFFSVCFAFRFAIHWVVQHETHQAMRLASNHTCAHPFYAILSSFHLIVLSPSPRCRLCFFCWFLSQQIVCMIHRHLSIVGHVRLTSVITRSWRPHENRRRGKNIRKCDQRWPPESRRATRRSACNFIQTAVKIDKFFSFCSFLFVIARGTRKRANQPTSNRLYSILFIILLQNNFECMQRIGR